MSKVKSSQAPHYELLYIIPNKFSENELAPIFEKVKKIIEDNKGKIIHTEDWGKKKLAYPIKQFAYGYYNLVNIDAPAENINAIDKILRITPEVLRHMLVRGILEKPKTERRTEKMEEKPKEKAAKKALLKEEAKVDEKEAKKDEKKVELKDLDEKLDKILEVDDLL